MPIRASKLLPSIGHATSGAGGTVVSTLATYPLDLVNTRLKAQRQLRADGTISEEDAYAGVLDAFVTIYNREGGVGAFFAGLGSDLAKSAADSFLFFLFYTWFRARRLRARNDARYLSALEELAVGAAAGMCAKLFTTPVSNVVTRKQMASLLQSRNRSGSSSPTSSPPASPSPPLPPSPRTFSEMVSDIRQEKGVLGLWAGYSASLVLTLNPSLTFFLQQFLKRVLVPRKHWDDTNGRTTFLLAAMSKSFATSVTYPFQIAKARVQISSTGSSSRPSSSSGGDELDKKKGITDSAEEAIDHSKNITPQEAREKGRKISQSVLKALASDTIFATVFRIAKAEGVKALYDGIGGELLKAFFNHGTTMLFKDIIHGFLVKMYFAVVFVLRNWPLIKMLLRERLKRISRKGDAMRSLARGYFGGVLGKESIKSL
ncbi:Mitochondrial carrier domain containing protein [Naviculisporaceae sp. PSN 640]